MFSSFWGPVPVHVSQPPLSILGMSLLRGLFLAPLSPINTSSRGITTLRPLPKTHGRIKVHTSEHLVVSAQSVIESTASRALSTIGR